MSAFINTVAGIVVGGLISLAVSAYYSRRASEELREETARLRRVVSMVIVGLVEAGQIEPEDVKIDHETGLVEYVLVRGEKMQRMTTPPEEKALVLRL